MSRVGSCVDDKRGWGLGLRVKGLVVVVVAEPVAHPVVHLSGLKVHRFDLGSARKVHRAREMCSGSEEGSYLRLIDFCITQL